MKLKSALTTQTTTVDPKVKSKLRIQIESHLIDVNEEMFAISDELARAFLNSNLEEQEHGLL